MNDIEKLNNLLIRSARYEEELFSFFPDSAFQSDDKTLAITSMCNIALEHSVAIRILIGAGIYTSAISLLRLQYETLVRAIWLLYAAPDSSISKLVAPLSPQAEKAANNSLPSFSVMMNEIEKKAPPAAYRHLKEFKDYSWKPLNSFVHGGIHAVKRNNDGYPAALLAQLLRSSNNISGLSAITLIHLINDPSLAELVAEVSANYSDCLQLNISSRESHSNSIARIIDTIE